MAYFSRFLRGNRLLKTMYAPVVPIHCLNEEPVKSSKRVHLRIIRGLL